MMDNEFLRVREIMQLSDRQLGITWTDGRSDRFDVVALRRACPCAVCIDEMTRKQLLKPEDVAETVRPRKITSVGSYALKVDFSDGHSTGIYTFKMLRDLADAASDGETQTRQ
jgi:ATP-binding protein involved in chromosome partitioning